MRSPAHKNTVTRTWFARVSVAAVFAINMLLLAAFLLTRRAQTPVA